MKNRLPVSSFGLRVLQKLNNPKGGVLMADGRARVKTLVVPASVIQDFLRKDLIVIREPNRVLLKAPGQKLLRRLLHLQKKAKNPTSPFPPSPYQAQHSAYRVEVRGEGKKALKTVRNIGHSPLSWLLKRKDKAGKPLINQEHFEAGEKLSRDFEFSGGVPKMTGFYDGVPISGKSRSGWRESCPTEHQIAARDRVRAALDHVGPGLSDILVRVCCFNEGLEQAEKKLSWPSRSGKLVLKIALDRLAVHYKLKN